jgi:hypothetical protein
MSRNTTRKVTRIIPANNNVNDETALIGPSGGDEDLSYSYHFPTIPTEPANAYYSQPRKQHRYDTRHQPIPGIWFKKQSCLRRIIMS